MHHGVGHLAQHLVVEDRLDFGELLFHRLAQGEVLGVLETLGERVDGKLHELVLLRETDAIVQRLGFGAPDEDPDELCVLRLEDEAAHEDEVYLARPKHFVVPEQVEHFGLVAVVPE